MLGDMLRVFFSLLHVRFVPRAVYSSQSKIFYTIHKYARVGAAFVLKKK